MKKPLLIGASALMLFVAGCGANTNNGDKKASADKDTTQEMKKEEKVEFSVNPKEPKSGEFSTYTVKTPDGKKYDKVTLYLNMEGMNHPMQGKMKEVKKGQYQLDLPVAMGGEWYAIARLFEGDKVVKSERFTFKATGDHAMKYMKGYDADKPNGGLDDQGMQNGEMDQNNDANVNQEMNKNQQTH